MKEVALKLDLIEELKEMRKILALSLLILSCGVVAMAQDHPRYETFFGFTYMRANSATNVPSVSMNGGGGQFAVNANRWLGFVADIGAVHNGNISDIHMDSTVTNYLFGPRLSLRYSRITPYFNVLFGGAHEGSSIAVSAIPVVYQPIAVPGYPNGIPSGQAVTLRAVASQTAFAMTTGGGLEIKINKYCSFRPIGLDYFMTRFQNYRSAQDNNQHNLRYTTGLNFTFGAQ